VRQSVRVSVIVSYQSVMGMGEVGERDELSRF